MNNTIEMPMKVKNIQFKNRIVMAPAVCFGWKCEQGIMSKKHLDHYEARAKADVGLIILQSILVNKDHDHLDCYAGIYSDDQISYLSELAQRCHQHKTVVFAQLQYDDLTKYRPKKDVYHKMSKDRLIEIKNYYVNAIKRCKKAGLDGVEIHGAHTYFLNVMASTIANKREDEYGGDLEGRLRFVKEMIQEVNTVIDDNFIIAYRMGWEASTEQDYMTARYLHRIGVDLLHVSIGIPINRPHNIPEDFSFNQCVYIGTQIKENVDLPVIVVNHIENYHQGNVLIREKKADFVAYGKNLLADSEFVVKSRENPYYEPCLHCGKCYWFINGDACPAKKS